MNVATVANGRISRSQPIHAPTNSPTPVRPDHHLVDERGPTTVDPGTAASFHGSVDCADVGTTDAPVDVEAAGDGLTVERTVAVPIECEDN